MRQNQDKVIAAFAKHRESGSSERIGFIGTFNGDSYECHSNGHMLVGRRYSGDIAPGTALPGCIAPMTRIDDLLGDVNGPENAWDWEFDRLQRMGSKDVVTRIQSHGTALENGAWRAEGAIELDCKFLDMANAWFGTVPCGIKTGGRMDPVVFVAFDMFAVVMPRIS